MIIPALDIFKGNTIRLYQGDYNAQSNYGNPISILKQYIQDGATTIHLVDLSGAHNPKNRQISLITSLIKEASIYNNKLKIQIGGGIRNIQDIEILLKLGVTHIVLGSTVITKPKIVKQWFKYFDPDLLILAIDLRIYSDHDRRVVIHGWKDETNLQLEDIIEDYNSIGLKYVLCTDIVKDGTLLGSNVRLYQNICNKWPHISFQASGGISNLTEISKLKRAGISNIIIGRAFLEKKFTVKEAISCWQNVSYPV